MPQALTGVRIVEMANVISGPYTGMLLADLGADVIKVEMPGSGDVFRLWDGTAGAMRPQFAAYNRGKRSITINVRHEGGREAYLRLAATADVVLENFRPGTLDRMGVGYDEVRAENPSVIYCNITGMGLSGPSHDRPTYDAIGQAMSGLWSQLTDMQNPEPVGPPLCDQLASLYAVYGVLAALFSREKTGRGQRLEASMLGAGLAFETTPVADYLMDGNVADKVSRAHRSQSYAFVAADGKPFAIHLSTPQKFWKGLAQAVEHVELVEDPRFRDKLDRIKNYDALHDELAAIFRTRRRDEWLKRLEDHDVPAAPINNIAETLSDPQVKHLHMVERFGRDERAQDLVGFPVKFEETPCQPNLPPPLVGEHTLEVLRQVGLTDDDIQRLSDEEAI